MIEQNRYFLDFDRDGEWYIVCADCLDAWLDWLDNDAVEDPPEGFAVRLGDIESLPSITFEAPILEDEKADGVILYDLDFLAAEGDSEDEPSNPTGEGDSPANDATSGDTRPVLSPGAA